LKSGQYPGPALGFTSASAEGRRSGGIVGENGAGRQRWEAGAAYDPMRAHSRGYDLREYDLDASREGVIFQDFVPRNSVADNIAGMIESGMTAPHHSRGGRCQADE
jgi:hypothetical protein